MNVVTPIRPPVPADEVAATLRRIADGIDAGEHGVVTTCVVVTGHTTSRPAGDGQVEHSSDFTTFVCGPRADIYTTRGLLLTAASPT